MKGSKNTKSKANKVTKEQPSMPVGTMASPVVLIAAISAGIALLRELIPQLQGLVSNGEITESDQQKLRDDYNALRDRTEESDFFKGPDWEKSGR
jgi:hypothetical protein